MQAAIIHIEPSRMGLLSLLQRKVTDGTGADAMSVDAARVRARRRLIGAVVLVAAGVVGFPLLFDTAPRPVPLETPVTVSGRVAAPPPEASSPVPAVPAPERSETPVAEPRQGEEVTAAGAAASASPDTSPGVLAEKAEAPAVQPAPVRKPAAAAAKPSDEAARALAALEGKPAAAPAPAPEPREAAERFVVQVGAFSEAASARTARQRVEKLGLKAYTQVVDTAAGKRIRVRLGPYSQREEADRAAARLKQAGLQPAVLTL